MYNTAFQSTLKDMSFRIIYGHDPPSIRSYEPDETCMEEVAKSMSDRDELLADIRYRPEQAQAIYRHHYEKHHRDVRYAVGDWVWLCPRHSAPASLQVPAKGKLKP
jgi:hypothetical protein